MGSNYRLKRLLYISLFLSHGLLAQEETPYSVFFGPDIAGRNYKSLVQEAVNLSSDKAWISSEKVNLTSISPTLTFPLFKYGSYGKKLHPYIGIGYFLSFPKKVDFVSNTGKAFNERIRANDLFLRGTIEYFLAPIGLRLVLEYHNDFVKYKGASFRFSNLGYGFGIRLGYPLSKSPKIYGMVFSIHKITGSEGYAFLISLPFWIQLK